MFTLTQEEITLLNSDPKFAAVALKLKEAEEKGEFVPKSRFNDELKLKKELETRLAEIEKVKKLEEEDKARKAGELDKLLEAEKKAFVELEAKFEAEKKEADLYRSYRVAALVEAKKQLKDNWLPEYESFSLESLGKLPGVTIQKVGIDTGKHPPPPPDTFTREQVSKMTQAEVNENLEKINKSMVTWK
jgi:integrase